MPIIATGEFSVVDYNDSISLQMFISSNKAHTQIYSPDNDTYTPDWSVSNLILTPQLFVTSSSSDVITSSSVTSVTWYKDSETNANKITNGGDYGLSGAKSHILTVKNNVLIGSPNANFICVVEYTDSTTNLDLTCKSDITFSLVSSGGGITAAMALCPNGNVFKNDTVSSIIAECDLWRGSTVDQLQVTYQWYVRDSSQSTDTGGGVGWKKITNAQNLYAGATTRQLTVYPNAVTNIGVYKCVITDTDSTSPTYNGKFYDTVTIIDQSDNIAVSCVSTGGNILKNGEGSTTITARLFRGGVEIDTTSPYQYSYKWYKYTNEEVLDPDFGGTGIAYKTGKSLVVGASDVDIRSTFRVEVE